MLMTCVLIFEPTAAVSYVFKNKLLRHTCLSESEFNDKTERKYKKPSQKRLSFLSQGTVKKS